MKKIVFSLFVSLLLLSCREAADLRENIEDYLQTSPVTMIDSADESGFSTENIIVELACEDSSADIWYSSDRSTPTAGNGELYTGEITLSGHNTPIVFKAVAVRDDSLDSEVITKDYLIVYDNVPAPEFSVSGGTYTTSKSISLSCSISSATIWYTTDGTSPKTSASRIEYSSPISLDSNGETIVINCYAEEDGIPDSDISTATYVLDYEQLSSPTFSPDPGQQDSIISISLSSSYSDAGIVYTTDGTNPTSSSSAKTYTGSISLNWSGYSEITIKAAAVASGMESSDVSVGYYYLQDSLSNSPSLVSQSGFNDHDGTIYTNAGSVALEFESPDSGADIFYTINGEMPMVEQTVSDYSASYTCLTSDTKRFDPDNPESLSAEDDYTICAIAFNGLETASAVYSQDLVIDRTAPPSFNSITWIPKNESYQVSYSLSSTSINDFYALNAYSNGVLKASTTDSSDTSITLSSLTNGTEILSKIEIEDAAGNTNSGFERSLTPGVLYVKPLPNGDADGTNWDNCLGDVQEAYDLAESGMEIRLAEGTYIPVSDPSGLGSGDESYHFTPKSGVILKGGYSGSGTVNDPDNFPTILSGNDICAHVIYCDSATESGTEICDVTVDNGAADASFSGGGMGGGAYLGGECGIIFRDVYFKNNIANTAGGAIYIGSGNNPPEFYLCTFDTNEATYGGGIYIQDADALFMECIISNNNSTYYGGGIYISNGGSQFSSCVISGNSVTRGSGAEGGGFLINNCDGYIGSCIIKDNSVSGGLGGGAYISMSSGLTLDGNYFENNTCDESISNNNVYSENSGINIETGLNNTWTPSNTWNGY